MSLLVLEHQDEGILQFHQKIEMAARSELMLRMTSNSVSYKVMLIIMELIMKKCFWMI